MGWMQLLIALAPVFEQIAKVAAPELNALLARLTQALVQNPAVAGDIVKSALVSIDKIKKTA